MRTYTTRVSATTYLALLFLGTFTPFVLAYGATVQLPQTGQTQCYDSTGTTVACAGTGHDGETKTGVAWPSPRFLDNGDGTITDKLTGLMWLKDANCARTIGHDPDGSGNGSMGWLNALAFVSGLNDGTYNISSCASYTNHYSNWHLPNSNELASIINYSVPDPSAWLNSFGFTNVMPNYYWSSTSGTYPYSGYRYDGSILVDMRSGGTGGHYPKTYSPYNPYFTWPTRIDERVVGSAPVWKTGQTTCYGAYGDVVACAGTGQDGDIRSGIEWPAPRFKDNADGTVTDNLTGLMWTKSDTVLGGTNRSWQDILNLVKDMNAGLRENFGYSDWRLPNIVEITSLLSRQYDKPVIPEGHPFDLVYGYGVVTWTSTSLAGHEQGAWLTDTSWGPRVAYDKSGSGGNGWPVRGGSLSPPPPNPLTFIYPMDEWNPGTYDFGFTPWLNKYCSIKVREGKKTKKYTYPMVHNGVDVNVGVSNINKPVKASAKGIIKGVCFDPAWKYALIIEHDQDGNEETTDDKITSVYWHIKINPELKITLPRIKACLPVVPSLAVEQNNTIGSIANLGRNSHLHFGIRLAPFDVNLSAKGALPSQACGGNPGFQEHFDDPNFYLSK